MYQQTAASVASPQNVFQMRTPTRLKEFATLQRALDSHRGVGFALDLASRQDISFDQRDKKVSIQQRFGYLQARRDGILETLSPIFAQRVRNEMENINFRNGIMWEDADVAKLLKSKVYPHTMNLHSRWSRVALGEQRATQTIFRAVPDDMSRDTQLAAEFMNNGLHAVAYNQNYSSEEAAWYDDGLVGGRGFMLVAQDGDDPEASILTRREPPQEFMFDVFSARNGHLDDCSTLFRGRYVSIADLILQYPDYAEELSRINSDEFTNYNLNFTLTRPKPKHSLADRIAGMDSSRQTSGVPYESDSRFSWYRTSMSQNHPVGYVMEIYTRRKESGFKVYDAVSNIDYPFESEMQAFDFYNQRVEMYYYLFAAYQMDASQMTTVEPPRRASIDFIDAEKWCGNILLDYVSTRDADFPYVPFFQNYKDGSWSGYFEDDKDPQRFLNRVMVSFDVDMGKSKSKDVANLHFFPKGTTEEEAKDVMSRADEPILLDDMRADAVRNVLHRYDSASSAQTLAPIVNFITNFSSQMNGGLNRLGMSEYSQQSGRSISLLQRSSSSAMVSPLAELQDCQRLVGQRIAYNLQFIRPGIRMAWVDKEKRPQFIQFTQEDIRAIREMNWLIEVDEVLASPTERDRRQQAMMDFFAKVPELMQDALPEIMAGNDWDRTSIDAVVARNEERKQREADAAAREQMRLEKDATMKQEIALMKLRLEEMRIMVEAQTPRLNVSAGWDEMGPEMKSEIAQKFGITSDAEGQARDVAQNELMKQASADLAQRSWLDGMTPEEKEKFLESKQAMPSEPQTGKDRINRDIKH